MLLEWVGGYSGTRSWKTPAADRRKTSLALAIVALAVA